MSRSALLVTWDGAGNLPPSRSLARALLARGHVVRALAHDTVLETLARDGIEGLPLREARQYDSKRPMAAGEEMPFLLEHVWFGRPFGTELREAIERLRPDLLLVDVMLGQSLVAARCSGLPTVALAHFPYHLLTGPFAPLFASRMAEVNRYALELGLPSFPSYQALVESAELVLVPTYRAFDEIEDTAANVVHVGPCRSGHEDGEVWRRRDPRRPLVLVGLSTSHQNQKLLLQRICDALGSMDVEAVLTTGAAIDPESLAAADNSTVLRFLAHDLVLPVADLLITHAGHGTVMAGITHGVPMLCFPMGRDQPMIADRVAQLGLGAVLGADATQEEIRRGAEGLLVETSAKENAARFARSLAQHPGLDDAVRLVEGLV